MPENVPCCLFCLISQETDKHFWDQKLQRGIIKQSSSQTGRKTLFVEKIDPILSWEVPQENSYLWFSFDSGSEKSNKKSKGLYRKDVINYKGTRNPLPPDHQKSSFYMPRTVEQNFMKMCENITKFINIRYLLAVLAQSAIDLSKDQQG